MQSVFYCPNYTSVPNYWTSVIDFLNSGTIKILLRRINQVKRQPALGISIAMQSGGNVIKLGEAVDTRLAELQRNRIPAMFFRANRQYILNIDSIHKVENWFNGKLIVKTKPDAQERIVVSRESAKGFKEWINQ